MFLIRVNDGNASSLQLDIRKVVNLEVASDRPGLVAHCVTASAEIPVEKTTIFARSPFNIAALELMLKLTSFSATIAGKKYELRPDLVGPLEVVGTPGGDVWEGLGDTLDGFGNTLEDLLG